MSKHTFLLADTETTIDGLVADFGAIVCDRKGNILTQCAVLTGGVFTDSTNHPLFFNDDAGYLWTKASLARRYEAYENMLSSGSRMIASVPAINNWLAKAVAMHNPILTAYNLAFDVDKCTNTGIDLTLFSKRFCLMQAAQTAYAHTKAYKRMVLECHAFNPRTDLGNMTFQTKAEIMARFVLNSPTLPDEPHTALEDVIYYELPILKKLCKSKSTKWLLNEPRPMTWRDCQVKDHFKPC